MSCGVMFQLICGCGVGGGVDEVGEIQKKNGVVVAWTVSGLCTTICEETLHKKTSTENELTRTPPPRAPPHWLEPCPGSAPSRPLAVVKRLMGDEPSVMRVDFRPRAWSIFT